ncbi:MAG TPA: hypothetical protein VF843_03090, partial [Streptosporangiaceae bacterium]
WLTGLTALLGVAASTLPPAGVAVAAPRAGAVPGAAGPVSGQPVTGTPSFPASTQPAERVRQLVECGGVMYAVGHFTVVQQGGRTYRRNNAFSFSATAPFTMTGWNPGTNGMVDTIAFNSGHCSRAYLGGNFTKVAGRQAGHLAEVSTTGTGSLIGAFRHSANREVETLASYQNHVLAGGYFTSINGSSSDPYLASLNAVTGRDDGLLHLHISGHMTYPGVAANDTKIYNQQISHSGRLDLVEGDFTTVAGKRRHQVFMVNLASRPRATLTGWTSPRFDGRAGYPPHGYYYNCARGEPFYIRAGAWSPDDSTVYLASTGYRPWNYRSGLPLRGMCDTASAFSASQRHPQLKWINYTGCDSLYSVAADASAVYFAGHERYSDNPDGCDALGPGGIADPGMEGLVPATGQLLLAGQQPRYTRARGLGADDMLVTSAGLWIASDNYLGAQSCGGVAGLAGICFLPYAP